MHTNTVSASLHCSPSFIKSCVCDIIKSLCCVSPRFVASISVYICILRLISTTVISFLYPLHNNMTTADRLAALRRTEWMALFNADSLLLI